jgi:hypothetical protein
MRPRSFVLVTVASLVALSAVGGGVRADWDFIYGDAGDESVSAYRAAAFDRAGGALLVGHYTGTYEGLSAPSSIKMFVQRKDSAGRTTWTSEFPTPTNDTAAMPGMPAGSTPVFNDNDHLSARVKVATATDGSALIRACGYSMVSRCIDATYSATGELIASEVMDNADPYGSGTSQLLYPLGDGYVRGTFDDGGNDAIQKVDSELNVEWEVDTATTVLNGAATTIESFSHGTVGGEYLWTTATIPGATAISRNSISLVQIDSSGTTTRTIRHFGYDSAELVIANRSFLWVNVTGPGSQNLPLGYGRYTVAFDSITGAEIGHVTGKQSYIKPVVGDDINCSGFCEYYPVSGATAGTVSNIALYNLQDSGFVDQPFITAGGRRAITTSLMQTEIGVMEPRQTLRVFDITGTTNLQFDLVAEIPLEDRVRTVIDVDDVGNILIAGGTDDPVIFVEDEIATSRTAIQARTTSERAFTALNPAGRIPLKIEANVPLEVQIAGRGGVPASGVGAAALSVTSVDAEDEGFLTVYPCGSRPDASNVNYRGADATPNSVIAPLSSVGSVCLYSYAPAHLLVDVSGYFPAGEGFVSLTPVRVVDTRSGVGVSAGRVGDGAGGGEALRFAVAGAGGVPASGVGAVALNVTAVGTVANEFGGFVTVYPCGVRPEASNLNFVSGETVANAVVAPLSASGEVCVYVYGSSDVLVDVSGYFPSGESFVPLTPVRLMDSR